MLSYDTFEGSKRSMRMITVEDIDSKSSISQQKQKLRQTYRNEALLCHLFTYMKVIMITSSYIANCNISISTTSKSITSITIPNQENTEYISGITKTLHYLNTLKWLSSFLLIKEYEKMVTEKIP